VALPLARLGGAKRLGRAWGHDRLIVFGLGQGALVTLVFNVLVTAAPKALAGDVGSLRGTTQNLAAAVGTAVAGALLVGLLSSVIPSQLDEHPALTPESPGAG